MDKLRIKGTSTQQAIQIYRVVVESVSLPIGVRKKVDLERN